ncbi:hypothetical protein GALMADRAFT_713578 [Galerina marginata CBS 339.88]|uniref:Uncharacterized protein n=1 Tax=Galerina marginata (strain CBS 339.88) TaxID=685588 RepID=A0A067TWY7_GALM3|nr:hypothetical protein GALMADRAFT_713578 [Galerina marginata CBS 339.88]
MSEGSSTTPSTSNNQNSEVQERGRNNNSLGKNQYKDRPSADDPHVATLLKDYHLKGITDSRILSKRLLEEYGVTLGHTSISRRRKKLGLWASRLTTADLSESAKRQLILDQMAKDPTGKFGATSVKQRIFQDTGLHLTRDYIRDAMKKLDPVGHAARGPAHVKEKRRKLQELRAASGSGGPSGDNSTHGDSSPQALQYPPDSSANSATSSQPLTQYPSSFHSADNGQDDIDADYSDHEGVHVPDEQQPPYPSRLPSDQSPDCSPGFPSNPSLILPLADPSSASMSSSSISVALGVLKETTPKMQELTRIIASLQLYGDQLDVEDRQILLKGLESAAFLERQLSRVLSSTRSQHYDPPHLV